MELIGIKVCYCIDSENKIWSGGTFIICEIQWLIRVCATVAAAKNYKTIWWPKAWYICPYCTICRWSLCDNCNM